MADSYGALIKTTTATTGTLDYVLATTALTTAHRTPKQAVADGSLTDGDIVQYMARDTTVTGDASFELGEGVYTDATNEIARDAANVRDGSNGPGVLTVWPGSGQRDIYLVVSPSVKLARIDRANTFTETQTLLSIFPFFIMDDSDSVSAATVGGEISFRMGATLAGSIGMPGSDGNMVIRTQHAAGTIDLRTGSNVSAVSIDSSGNVTIKKLLALTQTSAATDPTTTEYPNDGDVGVHHNTVSGDRFFAWNDSATIYEVEMAAVGGASVDRFAAGTAMVFKQAAAPTGWTQSVADNDAALRVVSGAPGASAGTLALSSANVGSHALSVAEMPAHGHEIDYFEGGLIFASGTDLGAIVAIGANLGGGPIEFDSEDTGGGGTHVHSLALKYSDVMVATKDA